MPCSRTTADLSDAMRPILTSRLLSAEGFPQPKPEESSSASRCHHLLKTFWAGFSDHQLADGTVIVTTPTGHAYTTKPGSSLFFPAWAINTPAPPGRPATPGDYHTLMMPVRKRTRAQSRADRIKAERALNDAHVAERNDPPPF